MPVELLTILEKKFPESTRTKLRELIAAKRVMIDGKPARTLKQIVDDRVSIEVLDRVAARVRQVPKLPFKVVFEDQDLLVIDKPAGMLTSSGPKDKRATLVEIVREHYAQIDGRVEVGLIHRLDKDASGLLVLTKNPPAFESLKTQFSERTARRSYRAIVAGKPTPPSGTIESRLVELADGSVRTSGHPDRGEPAVTHYETLEMRARHTMLKVRLETGRKHQIRVHLSEKGWPIAGDVQYNPRHTQAPRLMLVAVELGFTHPRSKGEVLWQIDLPRDVTEWWDAKKR